MRRQSTKKRRGHFSLLEYVLCGGCAAAASSLGAVDSPCAATASSSSSPFGGGRVALSSTATAPSLLIFLDFCGRSDSELFNVRVAAIRPGEVIVSLGDPSTRKLDVLNYKNFSANGSSTSFPREQCPKHSTSALTTELKRVSFRTCLHTPPFAVTKLPISRRKKQQKQFRR